MTTAPIHAREFRVRALGLLAFVFQGLHHVKTHLIQWHVVEPRPGETYTNSYAVYNTRTPLATYDGCELTALVVAAHDLCLRVEIQRGGPASTKLMISDRERPSEGVQFWRRHPELEANVAAIRKAFEHWYDAGLDS